MKRFSMLQVNWSKDGADNITFYIIPKSRVDEFAENPELVRTSLDAKAFYQVESLKYAGDVDYYDSQIDNQFDACVTLMGAAE